MSKILKQTALYSIGEIIPKIIGFVLLPVYTHYLSTKDYGIFSYTNSVVMFLFVLSALSLNSFVLRSYYELKTDEERRRLIGNVFLFVMFVNIALLLCGFALIPHLIAYYKVQIPWEPYFKLAVVNNSLELFSVIPLVMFRVKQQAKYFVLLSLSRVLIQFGFTYYFIVIQGSGLIGSYLGQFYPLAGFFLIYWLIMIRNVKLNVNLKQIKEGLKFSLPLLPGALAYLALSFSDRIILERYVAINEVGVYNVAFILCSSLNIIIQSGYKAIEPEIFKRFNSPDFATFIKQAQSIFFVFLYSGALFLTLFSQDVFKYMTSENFHKGYLVVPLIMVGVIMTGQNVIYGGILTAEKKTKIIGLATMFGAITSVCFNLILIPHFGVYAAAFSSAFSFGVMNFILYYKMNFAEKEIKTELLALAVFILIAGFLFYGLKVEVSIKTMLMKAGIFALYVVFLVKIFKIWTYLFKRRHVQTT